MASLSEPPARLEGVYTPIAHEGAPGRGDGAGSPLEPGARPGCGAGPHIAVGGWRYDKGHSRRGIAAPSCAGHCPDGDRRFLPPTSPDPPPPRGEEEPGGPVGDMNCLSGEQEGWGTRRLTAPLPSTPTPAPRRPGVAPS